MKKSRWTDVKNCLVFSVLTHEYMFFSCSSGLNWQKKSIFLHFSTWEIELKWPVESWSLFAVILGWSSYCSDSKSSGFSLAGVSFSLHLLKAVQSLTFHGFRNTISVLNLFSVYSPLFFVPLLTLNSKAPYPCLFSSEYSIFLESNCSSFSLVISGLNWERFPTVWLALGGDVETASDQNHAAAETGKLHSNLFLPKVVCSAFSWK